MISKEFQKACNILNTEEVAFTPSMHAQFEEYVALVEKWNSFSSLVSLGDISKLWTIHIPDSMSLAPLVKNNIGSGSLLDIGSGGGFPSIPVKILLPELPMILVERSSKKVGFLRKVCGVLKLSGIRIINGEFPHNMPEVDISVITARAVEKPKKLDRLIFAFMKPESRFLYQRPELVCDIPEEFHVEHVCDAWTENGLRRGNLSIITSRRENN